MSAVAALCLASTRPASAGEPDPFADVTPTAIPAESSAGSWWSRLVSENFGFRKELMSEFGLTDEGAAASRQSVGFEVSKKLSTATSTFAGVDLQMRLVLRNGFVGAPNDGEGMSRQGWFLEYHNAFVELYNLGGTTGRSNLNMRVGHFYVPFGINVQTDTHGTVFQLSNERNFGWDRDWGAGVWGNLGRDVRYDLYYLLGSGYEPTLNGQHGLGALRLGFANHYLSELGLEGGVSFVGGDRLAPTATATARVGLDLRVRRALPAGLMTVTSEVSAGRDDLKGVLTQLHQIDYFSASRRYGAGAQLRWFWQQQQTSATDASLLLEGTTFFRNDVAGASLAWVEVEVEIQLARQSGPRGVIWTLQYYRYW